MSLYSKIDTQLKKIIETDLRYKELSRLGDGTGTAKTLETNNALDYNENGQKKSKRPLAKVGKKPYSEANVQVQNLSHTGVV